MSESVTMDEKGRLLITKRLREAARVTVPTQLLITVKGEGRFELIDARSEMSKVQEIARVRFTGWREEEHEADRLALELTTKKSE